MTSKNKNLESKHFEERGFAYCGVNFKPTYVLGDGKLLFLDLVLSAFIHFNDHLELHKDLVGRMRNFLQDDGDIGIILKDFFKSKRLPAKQGWTDEFTTKQI